MNRICLIGRMGRDPEIRDVGSTTVAEFTMAVNRRVKTDGQNDADWFRIKVWGKSAEFVADYLTKGRLVSVEGRIETRKWTDKEGNDREIMEVIADNVQGLDRPKDDGNAPNGGQNSSRNDQGRGQNTRGNSGGNQGYNRGQNTRGNSGGRSRQQETDEYDPFADE